MNVFVTLFTAVKEHLAGTIKDGKNLFWLMVLEDIIHHGGEAMAEVWQQKQEARQEVAYDFF